MRSLERDSSQMPYADYTNNDVNWHAYSSYPGTGRVLLRRRIQVIIDCLDLGWDEGLIAIANLLSYSNLPVQP